MASLKVSAVDRSAPQSSALQAYRILERAVLSSAAGGGAKLPSERDLAHQIGVSRSTIRHVLSALADEKLVEASPQRGWFVPPLRIDDPPGHLISFTENALQRGLTAGAKVIEHRVRDADRNEQEVLRVAPATKVLELHRLRTLDGTPICRDVSVISLARLPDLDSVDLEDASLYDAIAKVAGYRPVRSDYAVHADAATTSIADLLGIEVGQPVLVGNEITYGPDGEPLLTAELVYRGDAYTFRATLMSSQPYATQPN